MKRILMAGSALALLTLVPLSAARADCAAAPVATSTDLVISFLTANTTQAAPASLYASPIKKGMLLYDGTANTFKYCDGTNWVSMLSTGTAIPASGSGSEVQFRNTATGALDSDSTFVYDKTNHRLGVGTNNPQWTFSMASDTDPSIVINGYSNTAATGIRLFSGRDGSSGTTKLVNGSELGRIAFSGFYDGKAQNYFVNGDARAHIAVAAAEDWTGASNTGTRMGFGVTPIGGSAAVTRMTLDSSGSLGIGIGTPNASALLDLTSTSKGLLPPRMGDPTTAITSPAEGLMAYDSTNHALKIFNGTSWGAVGGGVAGSGDAGYVQLSDGSGGLTSDSTSGGEFFWDTSNHRLGIGTASPSQALSVAGGGIKLDNAQELYWRNSGDTGDTAIMTLSGDTTILRGGAGTPTLQFQANTGTPIMSMLEDGKVGIGTAAPAADLQVRNDTATPTISIKNGADSSAQRATNFDFSFGAASARISSARAATATAGTNMRFSTEPDGDTGMVERMRIDVSGNIGIGTTTPKSLLDVAGGARVGADATCTAAKAGMLAWNSNTLQVCTDAGTFTNIATSAGGSSQWVNGTSGAIYYNGGNVGIGTTAPDTQLHIKTTAITNVSQLTLTNPVGGGISTGDIFLQSTHASGHSFGIGHIRDASGFSLRDLTAAGAPIRMIIDSSGNMGVGTETPAFQLTVSKAQNDATTTGIYNTDTGTGAQARYILNNGTANSYLTLSGSGFTSSAYYRANGTALLSDGAGVDIAASDAAGDLRFWTGGSNRRMTIQAGGNVGIGTTTPATPLEVAGAVLGGVSDATQGVLGFGIRYIGSDIINTFGSGYSTADTVIGYGVKPKTGAGGYVSSLPYGPLPRGALSLSNAFIFSNAAASTTATGTDIAMTERFRIDANGNVGIGTASPGSLLHVYGAGVAATVDASSGNANLVVNSLAGNRSLLALRKGGTNRWMVEADGTAEGGSNAGSDFKIHRYDDTGAYVGTVLSALRSSGYVGVGMTTAPQSRLDVNGGARVGADATCTAAKAGMLAWNANTLQVCTDAGTFTNIASSSGGSSQWVNGTSGTIYYNSGSVNIGTATPLGAGSLFNVYSAGTAVVSLGTAGDAANKQVTFNILTKTDGATGLNNANTKGWHIYARGDAYGAPQSNDLGVNFYNGTTATSVLYMDSATGNVGIGNTAPTNRLTVSGGGIMLDNNSSLGFMTSGGSPRTMVMLSSADNLRFGNTGVGDGNDTVSFDITGHADVMNIDSSGNVGIGTTGPNAPLTVQSTGVIGGVTGYGLSLMSATTNGPAIYFGGTGSYDGRLWSITANASTNANIGGAGKFSIVDRTSNAARVVINSTGNVGIGTTSPANLLDVYKAGTAVSGLTMSSNGGSSVTLYANQSANAHTPLTQAGDAVITFNAGSIDTGGLTIGQWSNSARGIRIDSAGNVGVGTGTPAGLFDVANAFFWDTVAAHLVIRKQDSGAEGGEIALAAPTSKPGDDVILDNYAGRFRVVTTNPSGMERLSVLQNGNVGIGTGAPDGPLEVRKDTGGGTPATTGSTDSNLGFRVRNTAVALDVGVMANGNTWIQNRNYGDFSINYPLLLNPNGGNVGIGTTNPQSRLNVEIQANAATSGAANLAMLINQNNASNTEVAGEATGIGFNRAAANGGQMGGKILFISDGSGYGMGDFAFDLKNTSVDGDVPTEIMRLKKTGNVGIGTNAPAYKLDVNGAINGTSVLVNGVPVASSTDTYWNAGGSGSINYTGGNVGIGTAAPGTKLTVYSNTNGPKLRLEDESDPDAASSAGLNYMEFYGNSARKGLIGYSSGTLDMSISNEAAGGLRFLANNAEAMRVTSTGNVGIGISSPAAKLDVASTLTNTAGGIVPNQRTVMTLNPASASSSTFYNRYSQINTAGASNLTSIVGDNELINHTTSATISSAIGLGATAGNNGSGTITGGIGVVGTTGNSAGGSIGTATGVLARVQNSSTGTITTARSIQAEYLNNGGGTVSSWYGLYVPSIAGNTPPTTDRFPIYVADAGNSYFAGNVGIGTTSPGAKLEVDGASIWLNNGTSDAYFYMGSNTSQGRIHWDNNNSKLYLGMAGNDYLTVGSAGTIRFNAYGAGTLTTDASGNITASSDERLKDIQGPFARGLDDITKINPILYKWLPASGNETSGVYAGMSAQDVQKAIPEAVGHDSRGYLTLSDRPIEAALINAVKELKAANDHLVGENAALKTQLDAMDARLKALEAK